VDLSLEVTEEDIKSGKHRAGEYDKCPVAIALKRLGFTDVDADEDRILVTNGRERLVFKTPRCVDLFINDVDNNSKVKPFICKLKVPRIAMAEDERQTL